MRQFHIMRSPKQNGTASADSIPYLEELGIDILDKTQPIQFNKNNEEIDIFLRFDSEKISLVYKNSEIDVSKFALIKQ